MRSWTRSMMRRSMKRRQVFEAPSGNAEIGAQLRVLTSFRSPESQAENIDEEENDEE